MLVGGKDHHQLRNDLARKHISFQWCDRHKNETRAWICSDTFFRVLKQIKLTLISRMTNLWHLHSESSWFVRENEDFKSLPSRFHFDSRRRRFSRCSFSFEYHEHVKLSWEAVCSYKVSLYKWAKIGLSKIFPRRGCLCALGHHENADSISQFSAPPHDW